MRACMYSYRANTYEEGKYNLCLIKLYKQNLWTCYRNLNAELRDAWIRHDIPKHFIRVAQDKNCLLNNSFNSTSNNNNNQLCHINMPPCLLYLIQLDIQLCVCLGRLRGLVGSALDRRSLPPEFESRRRHIWRLFHLWLDFITFGGRPAHLAQ